MSDILELGKAVNEKCQSKDGSVDHRYWAFRSVELLPELIAEIERLRSQSVEQVFRRKNEEIAAKDARIKTLQSRLAASNKGLVEAIEAKELAQAEMRSYHRAWEESEARIKELEARWQFELSHTQVGPVTFNGIEYVPAAYVKRLEAAFHKSETERKFYTTINGMSSEFDWNGYPEVPMYGIHKEWFRQQAREALERIKEGGKDEDIRHEIFSQRKVETPTECKHEWEKEDGGGILTQSDSSVCKKCGKRRVGKIRSGDFLW